MVAHVSCQPSLRSVHGVHGVRTLRHLATHIVFAPKTRATRDPVAADRRRPVAVRVTSGEGPANLPGLAETAALDELIDLLLAATDANDLTKRVAENMLSFDQRFWLRLATRTDSASCSEERDRLAALAKTVMQLVDAMVRKTSDQLDDSAAILQKILTAAADERTGEWQVPLPADKAEAMREALNAYSDSLDEALLSNCFAWMRKAAKDNLTGMVAILQKVLQLYAAKALSSQSVARAAGKNEADAVIAELIAADEATWAAIVRKKAQSGEITELALMEALQRRMEGIVLGLASGSYAQRVQAEYLKELEARAKSVFADIAAGR